MAKINVRDRNKNNPDKKPNWEYRFEAAKIDGKRKHISKSGFRTKKDALDAGAKALAEYNNSGLRFQPSDISVADYLDYWHEQYAVMNLKYNTQVAYRNFIENHLKPQFGHYKLNSLNAAVVQEYVNELKYKKFAKSTITAMLKLFSQSLDYAIEPLGYIKDNPVKYVKVGKVEKEVRQRIVLEEDEWETIINRFPFGDRFHVLLMLGYYTGMRIGEVTALTWDDIDFEKREIYVNKTFVKRHNKDKTIFGWYFGSPKSSKGYRTIKFGQTLYDVLVKEKARQEENEKMYDELYTVHFIQMEKDEKNTPLQKIISVKKEFAPNLPKCNFVCLYDNGEHTTAESFKYCNFIIRNELMIQMDFHTLRHTHATRLLEHGANVKDVQLRLGHQRIETTLQTYIHTTDDLAEQTVEIFEAFTRKKDK